MAEDTAATAGRQDRQGRRRLRGLAHRARAPRRGELIRLLGEELRAAKDPLGRLVSVESGKILQEGLGEVQEMIDICDFALGLSRQLYGLTMASERPGHKMMETWHPLGPIGVISGVQLPGRGVVVELRAGHRLRRPAWCGSRRRRRPLCALACRNLFDRARRPFLATRPTASPRS